jgi:hypothetical protein
MMMLTLAWLVGLMVMFIFMRNSSEPSWREKYVAEANIRRAIAYRVVDAAGGTVAEYGHGHGTDSDNQAMAAESLGAAPYGLPDQGGSLSTDALPGAKLPGNLSQIDLERQRGTGQDLAMEEAKQAAIAQNKELNSAIANALRKRREHEARVDAVREAARTFAAQMESFQYSIAADQQRVFNLDFEIHRLMIETDALTSELAQVKNDIERVNGQSITLEDSYYELSKSYDRTIKVLAWYEQAVPNLRQIADTAGSGWLRGKVVAVGDDPRTGIVSISVGSQEGVKVNQIFTIFRNEKFVARMVVESVKANIAVGRVLDEFKGTIVAEGDSVKTAEVYGGATMKK